MKNVFTIVLFLFSLLSNAQNAFPLFEKLQGNRKVVVDTLITRIAPSVGAAIDDTLYFGQNVKIILQVPYSTNDKFINCPWLKVLYKKGKFNKISFIKALDVSINEIQKINQFEVLWQLVSNKKVNNTNNYLGNLYLVDSNKIIQKKSFNSSFSFEVESVKSIIIDTLKTNNLNLFSINFMNTNGSFFANNFIVCNDILTELPNTFNYNFPKSPLLFKTTLKFNNTNQFDLIRTLRSVKKPQTITEKYNLLNCAFTKANKTR